MRRRSVTILLGLLLILLLSIVCTFLFLEYTDRIKVTVNNVGSETLSSVEILTSDGRYLLGDIRPNGTTSVFIRPLLDTNLVIVSGTKETEIDTFMRRGYVGEITIDLARHKVTRVQDNIHIR